MFNKKILQIALLGLLGITYFKPGYSQNINTPLCIASDTGVGGPRYIETTFPVEQFFSPGQRIEFNLRCRADVPIKVNPDNTGTPQAVAFVDSLRQYRPIQEGFSTYTKVVTNYGTSINIFNVFELKASQKGDTILLDKLGSGRYHEFPVIVELGLKVFQASYFPPNPEPISPLYLPILTVSQTGGSPQYIPYEIIVVMAAESFPDPCVTPTVNIRNPGDIDFGSISKEDLNHTISERFSLRISRPKEDSCDYPLYPIITFKATDPVINDDIQLKNGTLLSIDALMHSSHGQEDFGKLKFNTPIRLGEMRLNEGFELRMTANLRKNPKEAIKTGPFSTTVIYQIEYR